MKPKKLSSYSAGSQSPHSILLSKKRRSPFDIEKALKWQLADHFRRDANDFIWRMDKINDPESSSLSWNAKRFVDMRMSAECALKSIVISLSKSNETPENAYSSARGCSHSLQKLKEVVIKRAYRKVKFLSETEIVVLLEGHSIDVFTRYSVETLFMLYDDYASETLSKKERSILKLKDTNWVASFEKIVFKLRDIANNSQKRLAKHRPMTGTESLSLSKRFLEFKTEVKEKKKGK